MLICLKIIQEKKLYRCVIFILFNCKYQKCQHCSRVSIIYPFDGVYHGGNPTQNVSSLLNKYIYCFDLRRAEQFAVFYHTNRSWCSIHICIYICLSYTRRLIQMYTFIERAFHIKIIGIRKSYIALIAFQIVIGGECSASCSFMTMVY